MAHKYDTIVAKFAEAFAEMRSIGLADVVAKGGVGEILLAHRLGHELYGTDKGADGVSPSGEYFEYKVSITDQFNFHLGTREIHDPPSAKVDRHFAGLAGAICARRDGERILSAVFCLSTDLVPYLKKHFANTTGKQLNKNFSLKTYRKLGRTKDLLV